MACPPLWQRRRDKRQFWMLKNAYKKELATRREVDIVQMNREKQGRQAHKASVHQKGRANVNHLPGTSDALLWGCHQHTTLCISPVVPATMREIQNVVCLKAFLYMLAPVLTADSRH